jgi:hypothetical protein
MSHRRVTNIHLVPALRDTVYVLTTSKTASTNGCDRFFSRCELGDLRYASLGDASTAAVVASIEAFKTRTHPVVSGYGSDNLLKCKPWRCPTCLQMGLRAMRGQRARVGVHPTALKFHRS